MVSDDRTRSWIWADLQHLAMIREGVKTCAGPRLPVVLATYLALIEVANENRKRSGPSVGGDSDVFVTVNARLAGLAGISDRTVKGAVQVLEELGLVEVERRPRGAASRNPPNVYRLKDPAKPDSLSSPGPANPDSLSSPGPANPDSLSSPLSKKEHPSRRRGRSNSGKSSGEDEAAWDRFLSGSGNGQGGDYEPDDLARLPAGGGT